MGRRRGWTIIETLVLLVLGAVGLSLLVPPFLLARRNETTMRALRGFDAIRHAEERLYSTDLDGNRQMDYWTRDIRGLASFKVIDSTLAEADDAHVDVLPHENHVFQMLAVDENGRPLADANGMGERLLYVMYPASDCGPFRHTYLSTCNGPYRFHERNPIRRMIVPAALGWSRAG